MNLTYVRDRSFLVRLNFCIKMLKAHESRIFRILLNKKYGHLYRKNWEVDQSKCYYCDDPFYCYDHRPAISLCPNINIQEYLGLGGKFELLPSCRMCNSILYNKHFDSTSECILHLFDKYNNRLGKLPEWEPREITEMSYHMQCIIKAGQQKRNQLVDKILKIRTRLYLHKD